MIVSVNASKVERVVGVINRSIIRKLGEKEMDRKDFLKYSGIVLISVVGLKGIAALLAQADKSTVAVQPQQTSRGFGSGKYGG